MPKVTGLQPMIESDTPITDARMGLMEQHAIWISNGDGRRYTSWEVVDANFARELERKVNAAIRCLSAR